MAVVIRLKRVGTKKKVKHRIVVADSRSPRDGRFIENLGYWNPNTDPEEFKVNVERARDWIGKGAQPSDTVRTLLKRAGLLKTSSSARK